MNLYPLSYGSPQWTNQMLLEIHNGIEYLIKQGMHLGVEEEGAPPLKEQLISHNKMTDNIMKKGDPYG